jgi:hypothetical protein
MVTGFSLVLYSRLHLIRASPKLLRIILIIIFVNGFIIHTPIIVAGYLNDTIGSTAYVKVAQIVSHFDIVFSIQEILLSSLYIYLFIRFMRAGESQVSNHTRQTLKLLILAELTVFLCDIALNILLYLQLYAARRIVFTFIYAVKVKVEFLVLNRLAKMTPQNSHLFMDKEENSLNEITSRNIPEANERIEQRRDEIERV